MRGEAMTVQTPDRAPGMFVTIGWVIVAILLTAAFPYAGVAVALIGAAVLRAHWKLFVGLALVLLALTLAFWPVGSSSSVTSGFAS
jgi:hypothetical protein